ncbi:hypothetical protein BCR43DRAFT_519583 [Syncephalastrum racemosum]|uniref:Nitrogen regulatory protein areA GATA-like domain-containing protein n=1 Tax=Syncephalastrum racemosum TaxID=13706 RepID=A0A1X2HSY4_SYNRA|nr:hypothetical protein BCR43DRAFT_519583 [Syncephalastrum racemosum]
MPLDVPVVSLALPNIHKLKDITSDDLSCMWTVFTKCKDNLENGRRLENMSWRLWYRESNAERDEKTAPTVRTPIPIPALSPDDSHDDYFCQSLPEDSPQTPSFKHVSPTSFKRIISSVGDSTLTPPISTAPVGGSAQAPPKKMVLSCTPPQPVEVATPTPKVETPLARLVPPALTASAPAPAPTDTTNTKSSKFYVSDDEYETEEDADDDEEDDDDEYEDEDDTVLEDNDDGCWSTVRSDAFFDRAYRTEFKKQVPHRPALKRSNLTNLFIAKAPQPRPMPGPTSSIRRYHRHHNTHHQETPADLSQSLSYCVDWEQRQNRYPAGLDLTCHRRPSTLSTLTSACPESFHGW